MRVPRIGGIYTPRVKKSNKAGVHRKLSDPPVPGSDTSTQTNFGASITYYLKKYATLPPEIQNNLSPSDAIDMFREMEYIANGVKSAKSIGQGPQAKVYENPWLEGYSFIVLNSPYDSSLATETIYSKANHIGDAVWCDDSDSRIQLLSP